MAYKRLDTEDVVLSTDSVSSPVWTSSKNPLITGSIDELPISDTETKDVQMQGRSGEYYLSVYRSGSNDVQFDIAYADLQGKGGTPYNPGSSTELTPTRTVYGQFRSLVLGDEDTPFILSDIQESGSAASEYFFAITIDRARYKEKAIKGSLRIKIGNYTLRDQADSTTTFIDSGRFYKIVDTASTSSGEFWGWFLPDIGTILLDGKKLDSKGLLGSTKGWWEDSRKIEYGKEGALLEPCKKFYDKWKDGGHITLHAEETITSNYVFVRARNAEFNYSTNPSLTTGSGELRFDNMINSPQVYITSVGLYNDSNDLLAVAKLSRPLLKDFTKEAIIRVKLDY